MPQRTGLLAWLSIKGGWAFTEKGRRIRRGSHASHTLLGTSAARGAIDMAGKAPKYMNAPIPICSMVKETMATLRKNGA